jgi:hypothetical protein
MKTIVLVLRSGGDFSFYDVILITDHIRGKWKGMEPPRIICLWDRAPAEIQMSGITILPLQNNLPGTWARMQLYAPEMEKYRPFLYIDLDTAVVDTIENIFSLVYDDSHFITLEDFWQRGQLATGLVWFPANSKKIESVWKGYLKEKNVSGFRMDPFIRRYTEADVYWQQLTNTVIDFKPKTRELLATLPEHANLVCFHGKPRIPQATNIKWVYNYVHKYDGGDAI